MSKLKIGVLALQGAFALHRPHIEAAGAEYVEVIKPADLEDIDGLILPGGESGTMLKLMDVVDLKKPLADFVAHKPSWGICAGAILIAKKVSQPSQFSFSAIDIEIERNFYGRQLQSCIDEVDQYSVAWIRAPKILKCGDDVHILSFHKGSPVAVRSKFTLATTFHPELATNCPSPWHRIFVDSIVGRSFCPMELVEPGSTAP